MKILNYDIAITEARVLFFVYAYISNVFILNTTLTKDYLINFWNTILNFCKMFALS